MLVLVHLYPFILSVSRLVEDEQDLPFTYEGQFCAQVTAPESVIVKISDEPGYNWIETIDQRLKVDHCFVYTNGVFCFVYIKSASSITFLYRAFLKHVGFLFGH